MNCHFSCLNSCVSSSFTSCSVCPSGATLVSGACLCLSDWSSTCTSDSNLGPFYVAMDSFYSVIFPLVMLLYCLRIKLPYSYRIIVGLQGFSLLLFSNQLYLYFENEFGLRLLFKSNGFYNFSSRLEAISLNYAIGPIVMFGCFLTAFFVLYYPTKTFRKSYDEYCFYLMDNVWNFLNNFYYFAARIMFFYIGLWVNSMSLTISIIVLFCIFCLTIAIVIVKLIYDFHNQKFESDHVYQPQLHLYSMLSAASMIGLPLAQNTLAYLIIYLVPLGLLILIMVLNKGYQIITKQKILFYVIEGLMAGLVVAFVMISDPYKSYVLLGTICLGVLGIVVQMSVLYHSGIYLGKSSKVYPEQDQSIPVNEPERELIKSKKIPRTVSIGGPKKNYF